MEREEGFLSARSQLSENLDSLCKMIQWPIVVIIIIIIITIFIIIIIIIITINILIIIIITIIIIIAVIGELGQFVQNDPMAFNYSAIVIIFDILRHIHICSVWKNMGIGQIPWK